MARKLSVWEVASGINYFKGWNFMTRRVSWLTWLFTIAVLLVVGMAVAPATASAEEEEQITLRYMTWVSAVGAEWIQEDFIEPFQELHPNIKIEHEYVPFAQLFDKVVTYIAAGNPPDLMHMSVAYVYEYAEQGLLLNLQPYFERDLNPDDFFLEPMKAVRYPDMETGDLYAIPFAFIVSNIFYNRDMFNQFGLESPNDAWTWYDLADSARRLTRDMDGDGTPDQWGFHSSWDYYLFDSVIHAWGGRILDSDFNVVVDSPEAIQGARFLVDLVLRDQAAPPISVMSSAMRGFLNQQLAMYVGNMGDLSTYRQDAFFDWDVAMMPEGPAKRVVRMGPDSFAILADSRHPEEAWEYIKFVITQEKVDRSSGSNKLPICKPLTLSPEWMERDLPPDKEVFIRSVAYGDPLEFRPRWNEWHGARASILRPAFEGSVPIDEAMINWARAIDAAVAPVRAARQQQQ